MEFRGDFMKVYTAKNKEARSSIEILLNHKELKNLINSLSKFENEIEQFNAKSKDVENAGFTHLHLKDCGLIEETNKSDIIFYVDLDDKE